MRLIREVEMTRTINVATIQMEAQPAPTAERLQRAEKLVAEAAGRGAQLVVLPELFNTGYGYRDDNYDRAERPDGPTVTWLRQQAAERQIHVAGSLMLLDGGEIYNALLLFAPDGQWWRYDKNYPWGWERGYFRPGRGGTVAKTDLGDLGFLTCWDTAHPSLWRQYAGQIDLLVICSCPPNVTEGHYQFPDGATVDSGDLGRPGAALKEMGRLLFGEMINQQTAWLGVPAVNSGGVGHIRTDIPNGLWALISFLPWEPKLARYLSQAGRMQLACDFVPGCKVVAADGQVLTELEQSAGESFTLAEVALAGQKPRPSRPQPKSLLPQITYWSSDIFLPLSTLSTYRRGLRRIKRSALRKE